VVEKVSMVSSFVAWILVGCEMGNRRASLLKSRTRICEDFFSFRFTHCQPWPTFSRCRRVRTLP
jgi:hypothetical protein